MSSDVHGILTTGAGGYGAVQSVRGADEADTYAPKDEDGNTFLYEQFDKRLRVTIGVRMDRDGTLPDVGDTVTLSETPGDRYDGTYTVIPSSVDESNTEGPVFTLELIRFVDGDIGT